MATASSSVRTRRLPGFTLRGWVLIFSGLVLVGVGQYFALADLTRLGILLLALPLLSWLLGLGSVRTTHTDLQADPASPTAGEPTTVQVATRSTAPLPSAPVVGHLPVHSSWGHTVGLGTLSVRSTPTVQEIPMVPRSRGRYQVGPLLLDRADPFGLTRQALTESGEPLTVDVLPRTVDYPARRVQHLVQDAAQRTVTMRPTSDAVDASSVREYSRGDDVRRIHWRSTARTGEVMVRHDDTEVKPWLLVALDEAAPWGADPQADPYPGPWAFEAAVTAAASLVRSAARDGLDVRLLTRRGIAEGLHTRTVPVAEALEHLAGVSPASTREAEFAALATGASRQGGVPFLFTAGSRIEHLGQLADRHPRHPGTALLFSSAPVEPGRESALHGLRRAGWRVSPWSPPSPTPGPDGAEGTVPDAEIHRALDLLTRATTRGDSA